jgi:tRNA threonylcarbamoyladenosine biosynthesis protein TsaB
LAYGADKPVLPIDSLLIVAEDAHGPCRHGQVSARDARAASGDRAQSPGDPGTDCGGDSLFDIGIVMDARMGEVYAARYARTRHCSPPPSGACRLGDGAGAWRVVDPPVLCHPSELPLRWGERPARLAGNGLALTPWPHEPANRTEADRAAALLRLAEQAWQEGGAVPPAQALPLYLRDKVALTTVERAAARQSAAAVGP